MATGALDANGIWQYGEDDSNTTFSALLNRLGSSTSTQQGSNKTRLTALELPGRVLQVVHATKSNAASWASTAWGDFHSATITPRSATSKILVMYTMNLSVYAANWGGFGRLVRGTTPIYIGDVAGSRTQASSFVYTSHQTTILPTNGAYLDSPATTAATTYKFQVQAQNASYPVVLNRAGVDGDAASNPSLASHITLIEVAG